MAPPLMGHLVRLVDVGSPPPGRSPRQLAAHRGENLYRNGVIERKRELTWIHPLHAVGESEGAIVDLDTEGAGFDGTGGDEVVTPLARIGDDGVSDDESPGGRESA